MNFRPSQIFPRSSRIIDSGLAMLQRQVEARDSEAVGLAFDLEAVTDGDLSERLDIMLGKLIRIDPRLFLVEVSRREQRVQQHIAGGSGANLGPEYVDLFRASCRELRLRILSLHGVTDPALRDVQQRSVEGLNYQIRTYCR